MSLGADGFSLSRRRVNFGLGVQVCDHTCMYILSSGIDARLTTQKEHSEKRCRRKEVNTRLGETKKTRALASDLTGASVDGKSK